MPSKSTLKFPEVISIGSSLIKNIFLIALSFATSITAAPFFKLPYDNPHGISNQFSSIAFNPDNNFYSIVFVIVVTLGLFYILQWLYGSQYAWTIKLLVAALLISNYFLFNAINVSGSYVSFVNGPGGMDNFHAGEQLSPGAAYLNGTDLYSEMFYLRGAGVDVVIPSIGMSLFGKSVGSYLVANQIFILMSLASFLGLLFFLIRPPIAYAITAVLFYISSAVSILQIRDIFVWGFIGLIFVLFRKGTHGSQRKLILVSIGLLSSLELFVSIDRGVIMLASSLLLAVMLIALRQSNLNGYVFALDRWRNNIKSSGYVILGILLGAFIPGLLLGWQAFVVFLKMTFMEIPAFGGLLVGQPFPLMYGPGSLIWGPILIAITTAYLLISLAKKDGKSELNKLLPLVVIFIFGILCIKLGSNRIHIDKMASVVAPLFLVSVLTLFYAVSRIRHNYRAYLEVVVPVIICALTLVTFSRLNFSKILIQPDYNRNQLAGFKNLPATPDDYWISSDTKAVRDYIVANTSSDEYIFAFTSNPVYYYLTDRQNPSRFYVSWFADPQPYTIELLNDLKKNQPKIIIYKEGTWMDQPDNIPIGIRIPEVHQWIMDNYKKQVDIGKTRLLLRN